MILLVKKWFWNKKLKLQIDNDGIHTNEYLYENTGFSWNTPATIISAFYKAQMNTVNTYITFDKHAIFLYYAKFTKVGIYFIIKRKQVFHNIT